MVSKKREFTDLQKAFLDELFKPKHKGDFKKMMKAAGYGQTSVSRYLETVDSLKEEIIERAELYIALNAPKAAMETVGILDEPTALGAKNTLAAAKEIMDRAGLVRVDKSKVEINNSEGMLFILPAKDKKDE